jgi:hypothetical protein
VFEEESSCCNQDSNYYGQADEIEDEIINQVCEDLEQELREELRLNCMTLSY